MKYYPIVIQAIPSDGKQIIVYFSDGHIKKFDMNALISQGGVFDKLRDEDFFRNRLTVLNDTAAWDLSGNHNPEDCIDIDPFSLYEEGVEVEDPLDKVS